MKATAVAPANIAFIKYWGKKDAEQRLAYNDSISMNLSACLTTVTVDFSEKYRQDEVDLKLAESRVVEHLERIRRRAKKRLFARVASRTNFPIAAGIASSASFFAALSLAASQAIGLNLPEKTLSEIARLGSGSACRSIPDGFVKWQGTAARSLYKEDYWDLRDIVIIVSSKIKKDGSSSGMAGVLTSPLFPARLKNLPSRLARLEKALQQKNFPSFGEIIEAEALELHQVMMTQKPPFFYLQPKTWEIINRVFEWRHLGLPVYFTIDAGPNPHLIIEGKNSVRLQQQLKSLKDIEGIIDNQPAKGARLSEKHLF